MVLAICNVFVVLNAARNRVNHVLRQFFFAFACYFTVLGSHTRRVGAPKALKCPWLCLRAL